MRVDVRVSGPAKPAASWDVTTSGPVPTQVWLVDLLANGTPLATHEMRALDDNLPAPHTGGSDRATLTSTIEALRRDDAQVTDVHALGEHLFAALLGPSWEALESTLAGSAIVELALVLPAPVLAGLPWEMMRRNGTFLAAGLRVAGAMVDVAITRRVARAQASYPELIQPLRYMFVIGTELNDAVRAGAEAQGLLRQIAPAVRDCFIQRQSPEKLAIEVAELDPHVVHLICHGRDGAAGVELEMWNDDTNAPAYVSAAGLGDRLVRTRGAERLAPTVVILSACSTGARLEAASASDVAIELVARGVPIVIGMSAEIRDDACRLFTRRLGAAIIDRSPLLAAAIAGRRAALRSTDLPQTSFDWGMIQIIIGDDVPSGLAVKACSPDSDEAKVLDWLTLAGLPIDLDPAERKMPPLCGATEVLAGFSKLMRSKTLAALVLHAQPPSPELRVGKRRAFAEVAAAAIRAGHIPVLVMPSRGGKGYPATPIDLINQLRDAFLIKRAVLTLDEAPLALASLSEPIGATDLRRALDADARALTKDARAKHGFIQRAGGEVIVMLHDVHAYAAGAPLALELLGPTGAGLGQRVRVVMSWKQRPDKDPSWRGPLDETFKDQLQKGMTWIEKVDLRPLEGPHASLAFQRVLLHPFRSFPKAAATQWFLDLKNRDDANTVAALRNLYNGTRKGCLGHFDDDNFVDWLEEAVQSKRLREAKDDDLMRPGQDP